MSIEKNKKKFLCQIFKLLSSDKKKFCSYFFFSLHMNFKQYNSFLRIASCYEGKHIKGSYSLSSCTHIREQPSHLYRNERSCNACWSVCFEKIEIYRNKTQDKMGKTPHICCTFEKHFRRICVFNVKTLHTLYCCNSKNKNTKCVMVYERRFVWIM